MSVPSFPLVVFLSVIRGSLGFQLVLLATKGEDGGKTGVDPSDIYRRSLCSPFVGERGFG